MKNVLILTTLTTFMMTACATPKKDDLAFKEQSRESSLILKIQRISLSSLESKAPNVTLSKWLSQLGGVSPTNLDWGLNDCGEGGDGSESPTCVEGRVAFGSGKLAGVSVAVATAGATTGGKPSIWMMYVKEGNNVAFANSFRELESLVEKWRQ